MAEDEADRQPRYRSPGDAAGRDGEPPGIPTILAKTWEIMPAGLRRRSAGLLGVVLLAGVFEFIGVGAVFPFLQAVMEPAAIQDGGLLTTAYTLAGSPPQQTFLVMGAVALLLLILLLMGLNVLSIWMQERFAADFKHQVSVKLMESYLSQPYRFFLDRNSAELRKNVLKEVKQLTNGIVRPGLRLLSRGVIAVAIFALLVLVNPWITLALVVGLGGFYGAIYFRLREKLQSIGRASVDLNEDRYQVAAETFGGIKEIKATGDASLFIDRFEEPTEEEAGYQATFSVIKQTPRYLLQAVTFGSIMIVLIALLLAGVQTTEIVPTIGVFAFAGYRLIPSFQGIVAAINQFRFNEYLVEVLYDDLRAGDPDRIPDDLPEPLEFEDAIVFDDVAFEYGSNDEPVLRAVDLTIPKGASVGFVGPTGAGKTTILDLIMGLLEPTDGEIRVDGAPLDDATRTRWQRNIGYVPQDIYLRDDTVLRNIAYHERDTGIDRERAIQAAKTAHIHDFVVSELPDGYDTEIGEEGVRLSGGQRQRIGIARALYYDPNVLVLDEATSDIDNVTQSQITEAIRTRSGDKTLIQVAHRISTIQDSDRLFLVQDGEVVDSGSYEELLSRNDTFRELAQDPTREGIESATG